MRYDPERKAAGTITINVWCTAESAAMPEDIEKRLVELINGTFYTNPQKQTACAVWSDSRAFAYEMPSNVGGNTAPEVMGVTLSFDLLTFPEQISTDPDPIQGLNIWTQEYFPEMVIIGKTGNHIGSPLPQIYKPTDENPAIYWRFEGTLTTDRQSYAVNWYTGQFAAHVIADSVTERNRWTKAITELIRLEGEVVLADGSPMFANNLAVRHGADPLREGQLIFTGKYGVLAQPRKERLQPPLNRATVSDKNYMMEVEINVREKNAGRRKK